MDKFVYTDLNQTAKEVVQILVDKEVSYAQANKILDIAKEEINRLVIGKQAIVDNRV